MNHADAVMDMNNSIDMWPVLPLRRAETQLPGFAFA